MNRSGPKSIVGGKGSVKSSVWKKPKGMKNKRKKKNRLMKEAEDRERLAKERRKEEREMAYSSEYPQYDNYED